MPERRATSPIERLDIKPTLTSTLSGIDVACTLTGANQQAQRERWLALRAAFGIGRHEVADGLRLTFEDQPEVETELQTLIAVENDCCAWADWSIEHVDGVLVMAARSEGHGVATLHGMFKM